MGTDTSRPSSGDTANVVRIPRDWFGPKEDLVPFGPRPWADETERGAPPAPPHDPKPVDPDTFWGEDSDSVHGVLDGGIESAGRPRGRVRQGRWVAAAACFTLVATAGLATWLLGSSEPRTGHPAVASIGSDARVATSRFLRTAAASERRPRALTRRPTKGKNVPARRDVPARPAPTRVVYHASPVTSPNETSSSSGSTGTASTTQGGGQATAASAPSTSAPAFGTQGALGPMSSPDG